MGKIIMMGSQVLLNVTRVASVFVIGMAVTACSFNQDPYAEKSAAIQQGVAPELDRTPPVPKPRASDALRIDVREYYTFEELVEKEVSISARVLDPNPKFELSIDNLDEFVGATFDPKAGIFKWTPPRDTTGDKYGLPLNLKVRLTAFPSVVGGKTEGTVRSVLIYVTRAEGDPKIISVDDLVAPNPTREGEVRKFSVVVTDPDSADVDGGRPRLNAIPTNRGQTDISGLVYMEPSTASAPNPEQDPGNKEKWTFKMVLDLAVRADRRGRDFTRDQEIFKFGLQATSRYG